MDIGGHLMGEKRTQHLDLRTAIAFIRLSSLLKPAQLVVLYAETAVIYTKLIVMHAERRR